MTRQPTARTMHAYLEDLSLSDHEGELGHSSGAGDSGIGGISDDESVQRRIFSEANAKPGARIVNKIIDDRKVRSKGGKNRMTKLLVEYNDTDKPRCEWVYQRTLTLSGYEELVREYFDSLIE